MTIKQRYLKSVCIRNILSIFIFIFSKISKLLLIFNSRTSKKIIIISLHKLGDTVLTVPTVNALREHFSDDIYIYCYNYSKTIYEKTIYGLKYVIVTNDQLLFNKRFGRKVLRKKIRKISPYMVIDLTGSVSSASLIFNCLSNSIIGINEDLYRHLYSKFIPIRTIPHLMDIYIDVLRAVVPIDFQKIKKEFEIKLNKTAKILIHPFAGWTAKEWNFNKFLFLYERLSKKYECKLIFEKDKLNHDVIKELAVMNIGFIETENIKELMYELSDCSLLISNDSGPIHVASILGVPTFGIYGPTNPIFHVPKGEYHRYINKQVNCSPKDSKYCFTFGGRYCDSYDCMNNLAVEDVLTAVSSFVQELGIKSKDSTAHINNRNLNCIIS
jgi:heptosyltransferase II